MKLKNCPRFNQRLSPVALIVSALILAALMILADADQTAGLIALVFLLCQTESNPSCRRTRRDENASASS
jgi:hypothetical protein